MVPVGVVSTFNHSLGRLMKTTEDAQYWIDRPKGDTRRDWRNDAPDWVEEYVKSAQHPHRELILQALRDLSPVDSVLEIGCNAGPNLFRIQSIFPNAQLAGIDVNADAIARAKEWLPNMQFEVASGTKIPFENKSFDVVLADAVLMYSNPEEFAQVLKEIDRVAKHGVVLMEWNSDKDEIKDHHWARPYLQYLHEIGFKLVELKTLTREDWPSDIWVRNGVLFVCRRA